MKKTIFAIAAAVLFGACAETAEDRREREAEELRQLQIEDSLAFKIAVMPTLDCLPFFVAEEYGLIDSTAADINIKLYTAQMDCDTAIARGNAEWAVSDVVRVERMKREGVAVDYLAATNAQWTLVANDRKEITSLRQMVNKMIAMTRYSATDMLSDMALDSARLNADVTFKVQINDVFVRRDMLRNNEMDALWLTEPFASEALLDSNTVMMTTMEKGLSLGVIAMRGGLQSDSTRATQLAVATAAYNAACDTINHHGVKHFKDLLVRRCKVVPAAVDSLADDIFFPRIAAPRQKDIERAKEWLAAEKERPQEVVFPIAKAPVPVKAKPTAPAPVKAKPITPDKANPGLVQPKPLSPVKKAPEKMKFQELPQR